MWYPNIDEKTFIKLYDQELLRLADQSRTGEPRSVHPLFRRPTLAAISNMFATLLPGIPQPYRNVSNDL